MHGPTPIKQGSLARAPTLALAPWTCSNLFNMWLVRLSAATQLTVAGPSMTIPENPLSCE